MKVKIVVNFYDYAKKNKSVCELTTTTAKLCKRNEKDVDLFGNIHV